MSEYDGDDDDMSEYDEDDDDAEEGRFLNSKMEKSLESCELSWQSLS